MRKEALIGIGLTANEADIYLCLLAQGPSPVGTIVEKTSLNRTNVYDCLARLVDKGIVSHVIKSGVKQFCAAEPKRILRYLDEKEDRIKQQRESVNKILPDLEAIRQSPSSESVEVYEGKEGLKTILEEIIRSKKDIDTYGSRGNFSNVLRFYFKHYLARLKKSRARMRVLFNEGEEKDIPELNFADVRFIPKSKSSPTETTIFGDRVVIFLLTEEPKAVLINSKVMAQSYKKYFEVLWASASRI